MTDKKTVGRPKGDKPALTAAERMANTRRRKKIYKEESERLGVVSFPYPVDKRLLAVFEEMQAVLKTINVETMMFCAMKDYIKQVDQEGVFCKAVGIDDIDQIKMEFDRVKLQAYNRFKEEGLIDPRMNQAEEFESVTGEDHAR